MNRSYDQAIQDNLQALIYMTTMARPGSLLCDKFYPENYLRWRHVRVFRRFDEAGKLLGFDARIKLVHLKGHQTTSTLELEFSIRTVSQAKSLIFDVPSWLIAHAVRNGILKYSHVFSETDKHVEIKIDSKFQHLPVFFGRTRSKLVLTKPLTYETSRVRFRKNAINAGEPWLG